VRVGPLRHELAVEGEIAAGEGETEGGGVDGGGIAVDGTGVFLVLADLAAAEDDTCLRLAVSRQFREVDLGIDPARDRGTMLEESSRTPVEGLDGEP